MIASDLLNEDRKVKFDGVTYPDYGWCVILCGNPGIDKSTAYKNLVSINAKNFDADKLITYKLETSELNGNKLIMKNGDEWELDGIPELYNMSNPVFVSFVREKTGPFADEIRQHFFNIGVRDNKETLPNIVFDITGNDIIDFQQIIENVKPLGYKISVVWALGDFEQIIKQNVQIDRRVSHSIINDKLWDEWDIAGDILFDKVMLKSIDEFWVILQSVFDPDDPDDIFRHQNLAYVYQITGTNDLANLMSIARHMVNDQISKLAEKFK